MVQGIESLQPRTADTAPQIPEEAVRQLGQAFNNLSEEEIESLRDLSDDLKEMSPEELTALKQVIDFLNRRSDQYDAAVQAVIRQGLIEPGDLPPDYDPVFFNILSSMVDDAMSGGSPQQFARGGIAVLNRKAKRLAKAGRKGDTMVAHLSPKSADMLRSMGGSGTTNPQTGLKEYFLGGIFKSIGGFLKKAAGVVLPIALSMTPLGPIFGAAIGSGIGALINGASPMQALTAGLVGGAGGALFSGAQSLWAGKGFMEGVTGALPTGMQGMFGGQAAAAPAVSSSVSPNLSGFTGGVTAGGGTTPAGIGAATPVPPVSVTPTTAVPVPPVSSAAPTSLSPTANVTPVVMQPPPQGIMQTATNWMSQHPYLTAGGAALLGGALLSSSEEKPTKSSRREVTDEEIAAQRFAPGTFNVYRAPRVNVVPTFSPAYAAQGGEIDARRGGHLSGPGTGTSDSIPARLSDGEFVMTAKAVRGAGDGSRMKGAKRMYDMMHKFEKRA